ncbi:MAG: hypothetical protein QOF89_4849 [Acidobacteriota bacterium]|jgi:hypothetical protein|nr:hypothetical protein [Acidobacteriota bacterium]
MTATLVGVTPISVGAAATAVGMTATAVRMAPIPLEDTTLRGVDLLRTLAVLLTALLLSATATASAWTLVDCPPEVVKTWAPQERSLRTAKPGAPLYLPKPFPKTREEVLEDYLYDFQRLMKDTPPASLPKEAATVQEGIRKGTLRYEVLRIVNWSPTRCLKERRLDAYHLIRVFDGRGGGELTRSVLDESGRLTVITSTLEDGRNLRPPAEELRSVVSRFKVQGRDPQYVTTFGTLRCGNTTPCLAFRDAGRVYLVSYEGNLFEVDPKGRRLELGKEIGTPEMNEPIVKALGPEGRLVSLGGRVFTTARKVKG